MNSIGRWFLNSLQIYTLVSLIYADSDGEQPLFFNPQTKEIFKSWEDSKGQTVAIACPAEKPNEISVNVGSCSKKALFIETYYEKGQRRVGYKPCLERFSLGIVYDRGVFTPWKIQIGYEIFFHREEVPRFPRSLYSDYGPIEEVSHLTSSSSHPRDISLTATYRDPAGYLWIPTIQIQYNNDYWSLVRVSYAIYRNTVGQLKLKCSDENLGSKVEILQQRNSKELYSDDNVREIFSDVELPNDSGSLCKSTRICVKKYNLLLPHNFASHGGDEKISCSNLTTIAIWRERTEQLLNYSERFLIAIGQNTERKLSILAGVYGVLTLPKTSAKNKGKKEALFMYTEERKVFRDKNRIPIPRIIYKIVTYQSHDCDKRKELCEFAIVIAIQNQPDFTDTDKLCQDDKCEQWGWRSIKRMSTKEGYPSKYLYCCELNDDLIKKLELDGISYKDEKSELSLESFPVYSAGQQRFTTQNLREKFEKAMEDLIKLESPQDQ